MSRIQMFLFFAFLFLLSMVAAADAQMGRSGSITGVVLATDGRPIAAAVVTVAGEDGFSRVQTASADGMFSVADLPSWTYTVELSAAGFASVSDAGVVVAVGRSTQLNATLSLAGTRQRVSVTAGPTTFDPSQTSSVVNIDRDRVEELPIPSRNYLTFVLLSPQATPANPVVAQATSTRAEGGFGFGGLRASSNSIRLDGVSDDDEFTGGSRTQLSPEAISDFQIVNHGFSAEAGGAAGGSIDVQTRQGVNRVHGDAFVFEQNGGLNATPPLGLYPQQPEENRFRAGLSLGGALERDKTFYYAAAEQEIAHGEDANDVGGATLDRINSALRQPGPLSGLRLHAGFFATTDQETEISGRVDRGLSAHETAMLRYALTNTRNGADAFNTDELSDVSARGSTFTADNSLNGTLTSTLSNRFLNQLSFEVAQRRAEDRTGSTTLPGVTIAGVAEFGTPFAGNGRRFETHVEVEETAAWQLRHHLVQAGAGVDRTALRTAELDGSRGAYVFPALDSFAAGAPDFFMQSFYRNPNTNFAEYRTHAYVQDHWTPGHSVAVDYGGRYEDNRLPGQFSQDGLNLSPRMGVAWTVRKSLVVRSGFGIFYDRFLLSTVNRLLELNGSNGYSQVVEGPEAAATYRAGSPTPGLDAVAPSIWRARPGLRDPYSEVASLSAEQALPFETTLKAEYQFVHGVHLGRTTNVNLSPPVELTPENAAGLGVDAPGPQQLGRLVFSPARLNPAYDAINEFETAASSSYNGGTVTLNRQFTDDFQLLVGYTFSKTIDDASLDTEQPQNPYALREERALSLEDQRQRLTLSGLWLIGPDLGDPQDAVANANPGRLMRVLTGLEFAPILSVGSGFRENPVTGVDSNREHIFPFAARPRGYGRNSLVTAPQVDFDLRVLKMVALGPGHLDVVAESFNLLNHTNVALLNRVYGSDAEAQAGFGRAIAASTARRVQFSLDYEF